MDPYKKHIIGVTELNRFVNMLLEGNEFLGDIYVKGEISNFKKYPSGHLYFTLKDENASTAAVMWRSYASKLPFEASDGLKIIAHGRVSLYEASGRYQFIADSMEPEGIGSLYYAYEQLKNKLAAEGLFDKEYKKPLPKYPERIGIITSPTGAAVRDMTRIISRRYPLAEIIIYPSLVQGQGAAAQMISGIEYFNDSQSADVIIIGRGGGSIEDLWEFNNESLARRIFSSEIPVISAVGHESDFTICDFAADVRASTPSAAAELAVPEQAELTARLEASGKRIASLAMARLSEKKQIFKLLSASPFLKSPLNFIDAKRLGLVQQTDMLNFAAEKTLDKKRAEYKEKTASLEALSPLAVLGRGYGVSYGKDGKILKSIKEIEVGDKITNRLSDGTVNATVTSVER